MMGQICSNAYKHINTTQIFCAGHGTKFYPLCSAKAKNKKIIFICGIKHPLISAIN